MQHTVRFVNTYAEALEKRDVAEDDAEADGQQQQGLVFFDTAASPFLYESEIYKIGAEMAGIDKILFVV